MNRQRVTWFMTVLLLTLMVVASAPAFTFQDQPDADDAATPESVDMKSKEATVERILKEQEELLSGQNFTYDPAGRRDPFRSLFESVKLANKEQRPSGITGMMVTEVDLAGIVKDANGGDMGLLIGSDNKGYFLRVGDSVYDGTVIGVDPRLGTVTFRQQIDDPRRIKPYRDVVKRLVPQDDEESSDE